MLSVARGTTFGDHTRPHRGVDRMASPNAYRKPWRGYSQGRGTAAPIPHATSGGFLRIVADVALLDCFYRQDDEDIDRLEIMIDDAAVADPRADAADSL